ncbi:MAG: metal ABC transporter permease [Gemmataceae bacterium]|nr:metal ABC transporter permease [Gemmataceae bacterium]
MNLGSFEIQQAFWVVLAGSICGAACSILGCFLLLKRLSMLTDGIAHGVLPGIGLAVLITGQLNGPGLFVGAIVFGLLTAALTQAAVSFGGVSEDTGLGVVFTSLFAIGIILASTQLRHTDADVDCVFSGNLASLPSQTRDVFGFEMPTAIPTLSFALVLTLVVIGVFWKEWKLAAFDSELTAAMGFRPIVLHFVLVALTAINSVASFEAVGSILVVPMFIVPAAAARLLTDRLGRMVMLSAALAVSGATIGGVLSTLVWDRISPAGLIATVLGVQFVLVWIAAPGQGLWAQTRRRLKLWTRIAEEEVLGKLYRSPLRYAELATAVGQEHGISSLGLAWILRRLRQRHHIVSADGVWNVTDAGRSHAEDVVRAHRLWESYLDQNFQLPLDHLHAPASLIEHYLGPEAIESLQSELANPKRDPHGSDIPERPNRTS